VLVQIGGRAPQPHRVKNRVWMTTPEPFQPGDRVSVCWQDAAGRGLWRYDSPPLGVEATLPPVHGPSWTAYRPGT
jgi:hypothetical protein